MSWAAKKKAFCVEVCFAYSSCKVEQTNFWRKFQCRHNPSKSIIFYWFQKFRVSGTVQNLYFKGLRDTYSGRSVSAKTQRNIDAVRNPVIGSARALQNHLDDTVNCLESRESVFQQDLHLHSYQIQIKQELTEVDIKNV